MTTVNSKAIDEARVREQLEGFIRAFRTKDLHLMMSLYAEGFVAFDIVPPLQDTGKDTYRKIWEKAFTFFQDPIHFETRDISITTDNEVAFSHQLLRIRATMTNGQKVDRWQRVTFCFRKIEGNWLITHEHASVPVDLFSGKAVLDLQP